MTDFWFTAIYNNQLIEFKVHYQDTKKFNPNCWITTKAGEERFVNLDDMTFGEYNHLERLINETTIP